MNADTRWHRDRWADAVWSSQLRPLARLVALAYADHARDGDTAWVTYARLMERTGLSRDAVARHLRAVVAAGWLTEVAPARQHRATVYRLTIPQQSATRTAEPVDKPASSTPYGPLSSTPDGPLPIQQSVSAAPAVRLSGTSSPRDGHNLSTYLSTYRRGDAPRADRCSRHQHTDEPPPCGACREARERAAADDAARRRAVSTELAALRRGPECQHGTPGGQAPHPETSEPLCPLCRADRRQPA